MPNLSNIELTSYDIFLMIMDYLFYFIVILGSIYHSLYKHLKKSSPYFCYVKRQKRKENGYKKQVKDRENK